MTSWVDVADLPYSLQFVIYLPYFIGMFFNLVHEFYFQYRYRQVLAREKADPKNPRAGYTPIINESSAFFERWCYGRLRDLWHRPIASGPFTYIDVMLRAGDPLANKQYFTGQTQRCLNLASYNYLGFAEPNSEYNKDVCNYIRKYGVNVAAARAESGSSPLHREIEVMIAQFVGKEDAISFGMGYATNSTTLPALAGKGDLIISDSLNHASIVIGCRSSGAKIYTFHHNDPKHLERVIRRAIAEGQPRTHRPWNKILIVVEGIYSMEGEICLLKEFVAIKKKYRAYLYVDEAHSIGALGETGRGVCEHWGVNPTEDVDLLMGTFTKSFAAVGGYIAGTKAQIAFLRATSFASVYDNSMSLPCARQIQLTLGAIMDKDPNGPGRKRLDQLHWNTHYFRRRLTEEGFVLIGDNDSPVVPLLICQPCKMVIFSRWCLELGIAVVMASYPVTDLLLARARFCVSAAHTKEDLDDAIRKMTEIGDICLLRYNKNREYIKVSN